MTLLTQASRIKKEVAEVWKAIDISTFTSLIDIP